MSYLSESELRDIGIKDFGERVYISRKASVYGASNIVIGSDVRIDDYCVISAGTGGICIGSFVHIAAFSSLIGHARIELGDFSGLSSRVSVYSSSDDYSGRWMTNPMVPQELTNVTHLDVVLARHVIVGAGSVVLPGSVLELGVAVGALSLVKGRCLEFGVYFGAPARRVRERKRNIIELEGKIDAAVRKKEK